MSLIGTILSILYGMLTTDFGIFLFGITIIWRPTSFPLSA